MTPIWIELTVEISPLPALKCSLKYGKKTPKLERYICDLISNHLVSLIIETYSVNIIHSSSSWSPSWSWSSLVRRPGEDFWSQPESLSRWSPVHDSISDQVSHEAGKHSQPTPKASIWSLGFHLWKCEQLKLNKFSSLKIWLAWSFVFISKKFSLFSKKFSSW